MGCNRSTYPAFAADLEGTMLRLGTAYLFDKVTMSLYTKHGMDMVRGDTFWDTSRISELQWKADVQYLYGLLKSATKERTNPYIVKH